MKITIEVEPNELEKLLQVIASNKEQMEIDILKGKINRLEYLSKDNE